MNEYAIIGILREIQDTSSSRDRQSLIRNSNFVLPASSQKCRVRYARSGDCPEIVNQRISSHGADD